MKEYHKIDTVFKRDPSTKHKSLVFGDYSNEAFEYLKDNEWVFTEKVDGTNIRVMFLGDRVVFGGKTDNASIPAVLIERLWDQFGAPDRFDRMAEIFSGEACLYGEGYGAKIQSGGNYRSDQAFVMFDIRIGGCWLRRESVEDIGQKLSVDVVPVLGRGRLADMIEKTRLGFKSTWGDFVAEGIVGRPSVELTDRSGQRVITKIKHKDFAS